MNKKIIQIRTFATITLLFCLLCSLVFSNTTHALTLTSEVKATGREWDINSVNCSVMKIGSSNPTTITRSGRTCTFSNYTDTVNSQGGVLTGIYSTGTIPVVKGNFYRFYLTNQNVSYADNQLNEHAFVVTPWTNSNFTLSDFKKLTDDSLYNDFTRIMACYDVTYNNGRYSCIMGNNQNLEYQYANPNKNANLYSFMYEISLQATTTGDVSIGLGVDNLRQWLFTTPNVQEFLSNMTIGRVYEYAPIGDDIDRAEQATQEATDEGQQNSDSAGSDNEQASQNLLQTAGDIIGAFSAPATNCSISGDMGNINLGNLNFCQDKPSAIINAMDAIASIIVAFMVFRIIKRLIGRFTSLSAYGQGGSDG